MSQVISVSQVLRQGLIQAVFDIVYLFWALLILASPNVIFKIETTIKCNSSFLLNQQQNRL